MLIGVKKRFVFVANSKTASTTIESVLTPFAEINRVGSPQRKHISWGRVLEEYSFLFGLRKYSPETFFKFGVIREPADWVRSWFNYRLGNPRVEDPLPRETNFNDWWRNSKDWVKDVKQWKKFAGAQGECAMDVLIPLDELHSVFPLVLGRIGLPQELPARENKSPGMLQMSQIPPAVVEDIRKHYKEDGELYDYWKKHWPESFASIAGSRIGRKLKLKTLADTGLVVAIIDQSPVMVGTDGPIEIGGIILLPPGNISPLCLSVEGSGAEPEVQTGIHSPWYEEKHRENPNARNARFRIKNLKISEARPVTIFYEDKPGERKPLFKLELS
jgi:hypothetical protein